MIKCGKHAISWCCPVLNRIKACQLGRLSQLAKKLRVPAWKQSEKQFQITNWKSVCLNYSKFSTSMFSFIERFAKLDMLHLCLHSECCFLKINLAAPSSPSVSVTTHFVRRPLTLLYTTRKIICATSHIEIKIPWKDQNFFVFDLHKHHQHRHKTVTE